MYRLLSSIDVAIKYIREKFNYPPDESALNTSCDVDDHADNCPRDISCVYSAEFVQEYSRALQRLRGSHWGIGVPNAHQNMIMAYHEACLVRDARMKSRGAEMV